MAQTDSTPAQIVQSEAGEIIIFSAPNDGSITPIISPDIYIEKGKIEYDKRNYHILDENGNAHQLIMIGAEKLNNIIEIFNSQISSLSTELREANSTIETARNNIMRYKREFLSLKKAIDSIKKENQQYKNMYGDFSNPYLILFELYLGGRKGNGRQLVKPENFRQKSINTKNKKNREKVQYWLSLFEFWDIIDSDGNIRYANVSYEKAKRILKSKLGEIDEK